MFGVFVNGVQVFRSSSLRIALLYVSRRYGRFAPGIVVKRIGY